MKKIFSFAVLFAAISLVACGGEQPKEENSEEVVVEEVVEAPAVEEAPAVAVSPAKPVVKEEAKAEAPQLTVSDVTVKTGVVEASAESQKKQPEFTSTEFKASEKKPLKNVAVDGDKPVVKSEKKLTVSNTQVKVGSVAAVGAAEKAE